MLTVALRAIENSKALFGVRNWANDTLQFLFGGIELCTCLVYTEGNLEEEMVVVGCTERWLYLGCSREGRELQSHSQSSREKDSSNT